MIFYIIEDRKAGEIWGADGWYRPIKGKQVATPTWATLEEASKELRNLDRGTVERYEEKEIA